MAFFRSVKKVHAPVHGARDESYLDLLAPLPVPEVFEDCSEAAWEHWHQAARELEALYTRTVAFAPAAG